MDSMVNHYSVGRHRRRTDAYTPGGVTGKRPDYATVVYCNLIRRSFPKIPILIGGIEASLRRLAHYDYWSGRVRRSVLMDSQADLVSYGMGEHSMVEIAEALEAGKKYNVDVVPGVEISSGVTPEVHMLGYGMSPDHPVMKAMMEDMRAARVERMERIIENLQKMGVPITVEEVGGRRRHRPSAHRAGAHRARSGARCAYRLPRIHRRGRKGLC